MTIKRIDGKETRQYTRLEYEDVLIDSPKLHADRIGEVVIDIATNPNLPTAWVANVAGHLIPLGGGSAGAFTEFSANGTSFDGSVNAAVTFAPEQVQFCGNTRPTVGIDTVQPTPTEPGQLTFRVTPTGIPIDNPFSANFDMMGTATSLKPDFATLGDEVDTDWIWDLQKNPLAGIQCFDLGELP
jgi:hypothetical protein